MKSKITRVAALWLATLAISVAFTGCEKKEEAPPMTAAEKAASDKAIGDKALADKAAADAATAKLASDKAAGEKSAVDRALSEKTAADAAVAKAAADKAAAERMAVQEKAEAASLPADLVVMKSEISSVLSQIDMTIAKLEVLSVQTGNLKQPSLDVMTSIDQLDTSTQAIMKRSSDMRDKGAAYFDDWNKQLASMSTPEVAAIATKRKEELSAKYAEVLTAMQESRAAFDPFWEEMKTIKNGVYAGLTPETQKTLATQVKSVKAKAATLRDRVMATSEKLNQVSVIYTRP